jgi:hypothetical protein
VLDGLLARRLDGRGERTGGVSVRLVLLVLEGVGVHCIEA